MYKLIFFIVMFPVTHYIYGQTPVYDTLNPTTNTQVHVIKDVAHFSDSLIAVYIKIEHDFNGTTSKVTSDTFRVMPQQKFNKFIAKYFSYTVTTKAGLPDGNSVSITPTTSSTQLTANIARKSNNVIYNIGFIADFSNNISNVLSGSDVTSNTTFYTNISFLRRKHSSIDFDANVAYNNNQAKIIKLREFVNNFNLKYQVTYSADILTYQTIRHNLDSMLALPTWLQQADTVATRIIILKNDLVIAIKKVKGYGFNDWEYMYKLNNHLDSDMVKNLQDSVTTLLDTMEINNNSWKKFRFSWFSGGVTYTRQQYETYDKTLAFSKRVNDLQFNNAGLTFGYNYISQRSVANAVKSKRIESFYLSAAYSIVNDLNYSHIDDKNLVTLNSVQSGDTIYQFQKADKLKDISGITKKINWLHAFSLQTTIVIPNTNFMGINTGLSASYSKFTSPVYTGKLGLLFRLVSSDDQKFKLSFELFLQLSDWNDSKDTGRSTWQRKTIGFNTTIPFSKLFF